MKRQKSLPVALTIAGSDSGGGAGIQADLKTFAALGVHGVTAITCLTAQNPRRVIGVEPCPKSMVRSQLAAVFEELPPAAVKTGMLYSGSIVAATADFLRNHDVPIVIDPVMIATSGARLLEPAAVRALCRQLIPLAAVITPNLHEAEVLLEMQIRTVEDVRRAARGLHERFGVPALVKGGHLKGVREAIDIFNNGAEELLLSAPFVRGLRTHGTGCTYSAAITAYLAKGYPLPKSIIKAKEYVTRAIAKSQTAGTHGVLNFFGR